jgi:hypothetical protein
LVVFLACALISIGCDTAPGTGSIGPTVTFTGKTTTDQSKPMTVSVGTQPNSGGSATQPAN